MEQISCRFTAPATSKRTAKQTFSSKMLFPFGYLQIKGMAWNPHCAGGSGTLWPAFVWRRGSARMLHSAHMRSHRAGARSAPGASTARLPRCETDVFARITWGAECSRLSLPTSPSSPAPSRPSPPRCVVCLLASCVALGYTRSLSAHACGQRPFAASRPPASRARAVCLGRGEEL